MSFYRSNYYLNPGPYYGVTDKSEPVPGWGLLPNIAGGPRVGVGDIDTQTAVTTVAMPRPLRAEEKVERQGDGQPEEEAVRNRYMMFAVVGILAGVGVAYYRSRTK